MLPTAQALAEFSGQDGFLAAVAQRKPCVLRGVAAQWPAVARWTPGTLAARLGSLQLPTVGLQDRTVRIDSYRGVPRTTCTAEQVLREIADGPGTQYLIAPVESLPADVQSEIPTPPPCRRATWAASNLWVAPGGSLSPLHFDVPHNFLVQVHGRKKVLVFERRQFVAMHPYAPWSSVPNFSQVDPTQPDVERFPRFRNAQPFVANLEAGDALYLPSATWHHVTNESPSVSVNFWWARGLIAWAARGVQSFKRVRGIR